MTRLMICLLAAVAALVGVAAPASAAPAPSLTLDGAFAPPSGVAVDDLGAAATPHAVAVSGERIYTVGEVDGGSTGQDLAVTAHRVDGALDTGFGDGGRLTLPSAGDDAGAAVVALPDGRLRVAGTRAGQAVVVGLDAHGRPDTTFGTGGVQPIPGGAGAAPAAIALGPDGRLALAGNGPAGGTAFAALLDADGSVAAPPAALSGSAAGVAFRPDGSLAVLLQRGTGGAARAVLHGLTAGGGEDAGFGEVSLGPDTTAGDLLAYGGRLWVTGTGAGAAYLARAEADGSGLQTRRFQLRGTIPATTAVSSRGTGLAVTGGVTPALIVAGTVTAAGSTSWAAAAFNGFDAALDAAPTGSVVVPGRRAADARTAVAAGDEWAALAGAATTSASRAGFGLARLRVDAEKRCDLAVGPPGPVTYTSPAPVGLTVPVTNVGTKACGGTLSVPAPYSLLAAAGAAGPPATGIVAPGATLTVPVSLAHAGNPSQRGGTVALTVSAPGDANAANDRATFGVAFRYCDLALHALRMRAMPTEGTQAAAVTVRNRGTTPCQGVHLRVSGDGRRTTAVDRYTLAGGHTVAYEVPVRRHGGHVGATLAIRLRARTASVDARPGDAGVTLRPTLVGVGDSAIRRTSARAIAGRAHRGQGALSGRLRVQRVEVAVRRLGGRACRWVTSPRGHLATRRAGPGRACTSIPWMRATGTGHWRLAFRRPLAAGRYEVRSRAVIGWGLREARFGRADGNRIAFRVR